MNGPSADQVGAADPSPPPGDERSARLAGAALLMAAGGLGMLLGLLVLAEGAQTSRDDRAELHIFGGLILLLPGVLAALFGLDLARNAGPGGRLRAVVLLLGAAYPLGLLVDVWLLGLCEEELETHEVLGLLGVSAVLAPLGLVPGRIALARLISAPRWLRGAALTAALAIGLALVGPVALRLAPLGAPLPGSMQESEPEPEPALVEAPDPTPR